MENINITFDNSEERVSLFNNLDSFKERLEQKYNNDPIINEVDKVIKELNNNLVILNSNIESQTKLNLNSIFSILAILFKSLDELKKDESENSFGANANNILLLAFLEKNNLIDDAIEFLNEYSYQEDDDVEDN